MKCGGVLVFYLGASICGAIAAVAQTAPSTPLYLDASQPIAVRVDDLMARMTLKEKIGQLNFLVPT